MSGFALGFICGLSYVGLIVGCGRLCGLAERSRERDGERGTA